MFISHLNLFVSFLTVLFFIIRIKNKTISETILILFAVQTFVSSGLWLFINYYNSELNIIVDYFGIINENIILLYTSLYFYYLHQKINLNKRIQIITLTCVFSLVLFFFHFVIKKNSNLIFYPTNENVVYNLYFQVLIDFFLLGLFLFIYRKKVHNDSGELFDGNFKKYVFIGYLFYFIQDLFILILLLLAVNKIILSEYLMNVSVLFNFVTTISLFMTAIYTNWLKEYNAIRLLNTTAIKKAPQNININKVFELKQVDWILLKELFYEENKDFFDKIEAENLSKTEKIYAFFDHFDISHKDLSNLLNVSIRTIETNFYRTRRKLNS
jgi:hypothetical protein